MQIKLSDYIMEQNISEASMFDIEMEQSLAEVEVSVALCEAYFKQLAMGTVFQEALNPKYRELFDKGLKAQQDQDYVDSQISEENDRRQRRIQAPNKKSIGGFFKAVGNFIVKIVTQLLGAVTEARIKSVLKKFSKYSDDQLRNTPIKLPSIGDGKQTIYTDCLEEVSHFTRIFLILKSNSELGTNTDIEISDINKLLADVNTFKQGLHTKLKTTRANAASSYNTTTDSDLLTLKEYLEKMLEEYNANKDQIKELKQLVKNNKNIGEELAAKFSDADDKSAKRIYKALKSAYDMFSTYMANQLRAQMKVLDLANIEKAIKNISKSTDTESGDTNAKSSESEGETQGEADDTSEPPVVEDEGEAAAEGEAEGKGKGEAEGAAEEEAKESFQEDIGDSEPYIEFDFDD